MKEQTYACRYSTQDAKGRRKTIYKRIGFSVLAAAILGIPILSAIKGSRLDPDDIGYFLGWLVACVLFYFLFEYFSPVWKRGKVTIGKTAWVVENKDTEEEKNVIHPLEITHKVGKIKVFSGVLRIRELYISTTSLSQGETNQLLNWKADYSEKEPEKQPYELDKASQKMLNNIGFQHVHQVVVVRGKEIGGFLLSYPLELTHISMPQDPEFALFTFGLFSYANPQVIMTISFNIMNEGVSFIGEDAVDFGGKPTMINIADVEYGQFDTSFWESPADGKMKLKSYTFQLDKALFIISARYKPENEQKPEFLQQLKEFEQVLQTLRYVPAWSRPKGYKLESIEYA